MAEPIYRTVIHVEIYSEGPYKGGLDLEAINYDISEGPCIGMVQEVLSREVPANKVEAHLRRIGNDGTFFDDIEILTE